MELEVEELEGEELSEEDKAAALEMERYFETSLRKFKEGEIITGNVLGISKGLVTLDVGFKSEGVVNLDEFPESERRGLQVGDVVEVFLERSEDNDGIVVLSKEKATKIKVWDQLVKAYDDQQVITGVVVAKAKGGLTVDIG
ncbi:MAG: S1 RNA-binding domain-containing protein, partial [Nitrospinae bacterium]|nr:S1 RNA-binding domain-containing protein [Nitrospinota bacterium]